MPRETNLKYSPGAYVHKIDNEMIPLLNHTIEITKIVIVTSATDIDIDLKLPILKLFSFARTFFGV